MYSLFQEYLKLFEGVLEDYIESQKVSVTDFYRELAEVQNDTGIDKMDKKLVHFVNYLVACTEYDAFYKVILIITFTNVSPMYHQCITNVSPM